VTQIEPQVERRFEDRTGGVASPLVSHRSATIMAFAGMIGLLVGASAGVTAGVTVSQVVGPWAEFGVGAALGLGAALLAGLQAASRLHGLIGGDGREDRTSEPITP
jgi:hypothetical protein